ncbi:MAG: hypothetical protein ACLT09_05955 [Flavonifractor plautii]
MPAGRVGRWESVTGVRPAYAADAAKRSQVTQAPLRRLEVAVPGREPADRALAEALERLGCTVRREASPGVPAFRTGRGGFRLLAEDEEGEPLPPEQLLTIVALIEYEDGAGRVAVPDAAPAAIDALAAGYHGGALRLGRDGPEAEARYGELPWLRDALFAACRICAHLGMTGERLHGLAGKIPRFVLRRREVSLRSGQGRCSLCCCAPCPGHSRLGAACGSARARGGSLWCPWPAAPFCGSWERPAAPSWPRSCAPSVPAGRRRPTGACRKNRGCRFVKQIGRRIRKEKASQAVS